MLLNQAVQRSLLGAVPLVAERRAVRPARDSRPVACTIGSRWGEPARSQAVLRASIAQRLPAGVRRPLQASFRQLCSRSTGSFAAERSGRRMSPMGR